MVRLGDVIDDYCPRCKLLLNHAVASLVDTTVVKVVCQTCHTEHPFKDAVVPVKKKSGPRATLLDQVISKVAPPPAEETVEAVEETTPPAKQERAGTPARYITRHAAPTPEEAPVEETMEDSTTPAKQIRAGTPARYITRHATPTPEEAPVETMEDPAAPAKKEQAATPARYITRHATRPRRGGTR
jgi:hypothetical protein